MKFTAVYLVVTARHVKGYVEALSERQSANTTSNHISEAVRVEGLESPKICTPPIVHTANLSPLEAGFSVEFTPPAAS
jgi:hypothetical protein